MSLPDCLKTVANYNPNSANNIRRQFLTSRENLKLKQPLKDSVKEVEVRNHMSLYTI